ncbi:transposase [Paenibacillus sp. PCH8]|uniref:PBECR3 domain-containing polyvalent protein n=1 Tax=Paenibacillus sp. PCH8 TaxID=2066524 RepID=UPI000CFA4D96|nr:PBECR2 nuclease fold domain-containing protein [Paenibacillus sp. PCH8]PQP84407.1 transposase [Paenibacillus sp. PCH8]
MLPGTIGKIKKREIELLGLSYSEGSDILCGAQNVSHMQNQHPVDFRKYGHHLQDIIESPDYVSLHPQDQSIQYIKEFYERGTNDRVLVAVRTTRRGTLFARTLFVMSKDKWANYNDKGYIKVY